MLLVHCKVCPGSASLKPQHRTVCLSVRHGHGPVCRSPPAACIIRPVSPQRRALKPGVCSLNFISPGFVRHASQKHRCRSANAAAPGVDEEAVTNEQLYRSLQSPEPYVGNIAVKEAGGKRCTLKLVCHQQQCVTNLLVGRQASERALFPSSLM